MLIPTTGDVTLWGNPTGNQGIYTAITDVVNADFTNVGTSFQSVTGYNTDDLPEYATQEGTSPFIVFNSRTINS
jgi:hypothetical protein